MDACVCRTGRHWSSTSLATRERRNVHWKQSFACVSPSTRPTQCLVGQAGPQLRNQKYNKVFCNLNHEAPILEARSINELYDALAERLLPIAARIKDPYFKHIVGLAGPPGAGKSTLSSEVVKRVNKLWSQKLSPIDNEVETPNIAIVLPMDGFHLYNSQLDAMEDPNEAHARRGAPWTFDPARLLTCLNTLRAQGSVYAPSFDHGVGDPVEDDIFLSLQHQLVVVEGNYLLMEDGIWNEFIQWGNVNALVPNLHHFRHCLPIADQFGDIYISMKSKLTQNFRHQIVVVEGNYLLMEDGIWKEISSVFDEKWFVEVDIYNAMQRVLKRHISTGKPPDVAKWRIEYNDRPNAELIMKSKRNADLVIKSVDI